MRLIQRISAVLTALLMLPACTLADDGAPDYRYRLTVEVETPQGVRRGSSVIAVEQSMGSTAMSGFGQRVDRRVRGEAVAVDLPGGQTLFALLRSADNIDWAAYVVPLLAPQRPDLPFEEQVAQVLALEGQGAVTLPRTWPPVGHLPERTAYPMLVTFRDPSDPTSVEEVDPDDLAATFGPGTRLRRITVELTEDAVTEGIEGRLGWLRTTAGSLKHIPLDDYPPAGTPLPLHATLTERDFHQGSTP